MRKLRTLRFIALFLLVNMLYEICFPTVAFALTGGPSQPEVESFEPVSTTQMVDPFTGDFNYNIPLMDVDGYPVNISYHSGVTMDQEASWVGLGWNLNPGVINRNMRGLPDDFSGENDEIEKKMYIKDNKTYGISVGAGLEFYGKSPIKTVLGGSYNIGVNYNNYTGVGIESSIVPMISAVYEAKNSYLKSIGMGGDLAFSSSSKDGLTIKPSAGMHGQLSAAFAGLGINVAPSVSIGMSVNSRAGIQYLSFGHSVGGGVSVFGASKGTSFMNGSSVSFATQTYTPSMEMQMINSNITFNAKVGGELWGLHPNANLTGYYSGQSIAQTTQARPAYGYLNADGAKNNDIALMDFNREKDGSYSNENPVLAIPSQTYDLFNASGHGVAGMFRAYRSDIAILSDPYMSSISGGDNVSLELGLGNAYKSGFNVTTNSSTITTGAWKKYNSLYNKIGYKGKQVDSDPLYEPAYFKNVGEKNAIEENLLSYTEIGNPLRPKIQGDNGEYYTLINSLVKKENNIEEAIDISDVSAFKTQREKKNQLLTFLKVSEKDFCLERLISYGDPTKLPSDPAGGNSMTRDDGQRKANHITEVTVTNTQGMRYVYGIAAYNNSQYDFTFTNAKDPDISSIVPTKDCEKGQVQYDITPGHGITYDNPNYTSRDYKGNNYFFNATKTPAYAHSYLLTSVLAPDYIDVNGNGPDYADLGDYTKIGYYRVSDAYKWRVPVNEGYANYNEGYKSDATDDMASFMYGEKEMWLVRTIEGKNNIAYFYISKREDALGVAGETGGIKDGSGAIKTGVKYSYKLDSIALYSKADRLNPIKKVYFEYDYSLCPNVENNSGKAVKADGSTATIPDDNINVSQGKLTLKRIYFAYGSIFKTKGRFNSYVFNYDGYNPGYNLKAYDRWGNYKGNPSDIATCTSLTNSEFPYTDQTDASATNAAASAWSMTSITLPSGGTIEITYESDDYAYVQNRKAMQMYKVEGFAESESDVHNVTDLQDGLYQNQGLFVPTKLYRYIFFKIPDDRQTSSSFIDDVLSGGNTLYYNCLVNLTDDDNPNYEYVRGYTTIESAGTKTITVGSEDKTYGWVRVNASGDYHPIAESAWQLARIHLPYLVYPGSNLRLNGTTSETIQAIMRGLLGYLVEAADMLDGMNDKLQRNNYGRNVDLAKSWIRLNNLTGHKYGGGCRVQKITMSDNWNMMGQSGSALETKYGQEYEYKTKETFNGEERIISSGVAAYEPILGNDENPFRMPVSYDKTHWGVPDDHFYAEEPFGESFFPAPQVGYSRVTVKNLAVENVTKHATGKVVHEFYTAREFPVITQRTNLDAKNYQPSYIFSVIKFTNERYLTASQGFQVELNDMHGKPKAVWNYNEANIDSYKTDAAFSGVEYKYQVEDENASIKQLKNTFKVINANNQVSEETVGVDVDMAMDSREMKSTAISSSKAFNLDASVALFPLLVACIWPESNTEITGFRSAVISRVINRYGIQTETIAHEEGAKISTKNLMLDAETGEVLLTSTQNEFNDDVFNATYPAHWVSDYDGMGPAYKNAGLEIKVEPLSGTLNKAFAAVVNGSQVMDMSAYFAPGDEVTVSFGTSVQKRWVYFSESSGSWYLIDQGGDPLLLSDDNTYTVKVLRSGRRNLQNIPVAQVTSMINPEVSSQLNHTVNSAVINASAAEFKDKWRMQLNDYSLVNCNDILINYNQAQLEDEFATMIPVILSNSGVTRTIDVASDHGVAHNSISLTQSDFSSCTNIYNMIDEYKDCIGGTVPITCYVDQTTSSTSNLTLLNTPTFTIYRTISIDLTIGNYNFKLNGYVLRQTSSWNLSTKVSCQWKIPAYTDEDFSSIYNYSSTIPTTISSLSSLNSTTYVYPQLQTATYNAVYGLDALGSPSSYDYTFTDGTTTKYYIASGNTSDLPGSFLTHRADIGVNECPSAGVSYSTSVDNTLTAYYNNTLTGANHNISLMVNLVFYKGPIQTNYVAGTPGTIITPTSANITSQINSSSVVMKIPCHTFTPSEVVNPYLAGIRGNWRKSKDWVYYDNRTPQTTAATNIRLDGTYKTFDPFWKWSSSTNKWVNNSSSTNWTMQNQTTKCSPAGQALESADALQRYSAALYDDQHTNQVLAVANNAKFSQIAMDNMEVYPVGGRPLAECPVGHFSFWNSSDFDISTEAHTGTKSLRVYATHSATTSRDLAQEDDLPTNNGPYGFELDVQKDMNGQFNPEPGDYIVSTWIKVDDDPVRPTYAAVTGTQSARVDISFEGSASTFSFVPAGPIVEGWQRVEGTFTVPEDAIKIQVSLVASTETGSVYTLFDDLRFHPANATMKTYVYDPLTLRLIAELDENNYAVFYEYDKAGKLVRTKRETEKGRATIKESRNGQYKQ